MEKIVGTRNQRVLRGLCPIVEAVRDQEKQVRCLSDSAFPEKIRELKAQVADGTRLDDVLPMTFALVREAATRVLGMRHFDVQIMGGVILHRGCIAEMATGEGKTLVATLAATLNALEERGVHVVTVNDYLARRDRDWMGPVFRFLGLSVGVIQRDLEPWQRQQSYRCDVTYGTNNELGFDYLRDNMVLTKEHMVHRGFHYAIVDEVDSVLVDEARTPLIISGPAEDFTEKYYIVDKVVRRLKKEKDYQIDEKAKNASLTEEGVAHCEQLLRVDNLYDERHMDLVHHILQALKAHHLFRLDDEYVVSEGQVIIVDEFTGRLMPGRRFSDGLHQALEAKEGVKIERENQTLATITFQNLFRMYKKLSGMTGTAMTEAEEFQKIYKLEVVAMPTNRPLIRNQYADVVYKTEREKVNAVVEEIVDLHQQKRPVLVGTISIERSEKLSKMLKRRQIFHHVLNAKYHEREAEIISKAGQPGAVTISTNMAGRGTDIVLGEGVSGKGGLHVLGTERHESRRIDNQLRGRAGRQGDPGSSRFYLSLEDDLMRIFGSDRIKRLMERMGMEEGEVIEHKWVSKAIESAQKRVEAYNFDIRKRLLEYDNVMNKQREVIYEQRQRILEDDDLNPLLLEIVKEVAEECVVPYCDEDMHVEDWNLAGLTEWLAATFRVDTSDLPLQIQSKNELPSWVDRIKEKLRLTYESKMQQLPEELRTRFLREISLHVLDTRWKEHLYAMDNLREGIGLRAYGQMDPLVEYQHEGFDMFSSMVIRMKQEILEYLLRVQLLSDELHSRSVYEGGRAESPQDGGAFSVSSASRRPAARRQPAMASLPGTVSGDMPGAIPGAVATASGEGSSPSQEQVKRDEPKVGRNDPCPCGSGKKYKKCCGV